MGDVVAQAFLTSQFLAIVVEHTPGGNLLDYVKNNSPDIQGVGLHEETARCGNSTGPQLHIPQNAASILCIDGSWVH